MKPGYIAWDINYLVGRKQLERLSWGLLNLNGQLLDSCKLNNYSRDTFLVRIALPEGKEDLFRIITNLTPEKPFQNTNGTTQTQDR